MKYIKIHSSCICYCRMLPRSIVTTKLFPGINDWSASLWSRISVHRPHSVIFSSRWRTWFRIFSMRIFKLGISSLSLEHLHYCLIWRIVIFPRLIYLLMVSIFSLLDFKLKCYSGQSDVVWSEAFSKAEVTTYRLNPVPVTATELVPPTDCPAIRPSILDHGRAFYIMVFWKLCRCVWH